MRAATIVCCFLLFAAFACAQPPTRPKITGIDHVSFYTTNSAANNHFYTAVLGLSTADPIESGQTQRFMIGPQWVAYSPAPDPKVNDRMDHVAFATENAEGLRAYLAGQGIQVPPSLSARKDGAHSFIVKDPEGHSVEFVQAKVAAENRGTSGSDPISRRMIHAGFIVNNRPAEDHFYKDILGFRLYWYGGMQPGRTDWVAMQVPDGTEWLEYMLNQPEHPDLRTTGVMHHISLGVRDIKQAQARLEARGWKPNDRERAQMGKDGKWQLNVYDPDQTRVELMEFTPAEKPCCSEFQGPHPSE